MVLEVVLLSITIIALLIASYSDLRTREVPDWLSYGLIFAALGIRTIFSFQRGWPIIVSGLIGVLICYAISSVLYYTDQWGGGDSKLLMGMGAVIGITYPFAASSFRLGLFMLLLLFVGAGYGLLWMAGIAVRRRVQFWGKFKERMQKYRSLHLGLIVLSLGFVVFSFLYGFLWPLVPLPLGLFYLLSFVTIIEDNFFVRRIPVGKLTEGDWLAEDVRKAGRTIMGERTLERQDLDRIRSVGLERVSIREGIPFVPIFLISYLLLVFGKGLGAWVVGLV